MTVGSSLATKNLIIALAICAAIVAGVPAASSSADLRFPGGKYAGTSWDYSNWRERCAYAGYYSLYAWHGSVYHFRWDEYPLPLRLLPRRQKTRY